MFKEGKVMKRGKRAEGREKHKMAMDAKEIAIGVGTQAEVVAESSIVE